MIELAKAAKECKTFQHRVIADHQGPWYDTPKQSIYGNCDYKGSFGFNFQTYQYRVKQEPIVGWYVFQEVEKSAIYPNGLCRDMMYFDEESAKKSADKSTNRFYVKVLQEGPRIYGKG